MQITDMQHISKKVHKTLRDVVQKKILFKELH